MRQQYSDWVYPAPIDDLDVWSQTLRHADDPKIMHWAYWPTTGYPKALRILVAGCGANQAAAIAHANPDAMVTGIDLSRSSLDHEEYLRDKHRLSNLNLQQCAIEDAPGLGQEFDHISAVGVLHHMRDPVAGLRVLGQCLHRDGVISAMVYGKYFRTGVYMLQDLFHRLGLRQTPQDVEIVKSCIAALDPDHAAVPYIKRAPDLGFDAGLVDSFLHAQDRAYTVRECLELCADAGLVFQGWENNWAYHLESVAAAGTPFYERMKTLEGPALWEAMELFLGTNGQHRFYACRRDRPQSSYRLALGGDEIFDYIPVRSIDRIIPADGTSSRAPGIKRGFGPVVPLEPAQAALFDQFDGQRTLAECIERSRIQAGETDTRTFARNFVRSLWHMGYVFLRMPTASRDTA